MADKTLYKKIKERQGRLAAVRRQYEDGWEEILDYLRPELSAWGDTGQNEKGNKRNTKVYSARPAEALEIWKDGTLGNTASPSIAWFRYVMANKELNDIPEVRKWLQEVERNIYSIFRDSNFYQTLNPVHLDAGSIGNGSMFIEEAKKVAGIDCSTFHPREPFVAENSRGQVNVWHRKFEMTAVNAAAEFGKENLSVALNDNLTNNPQNKHTFIHGIYEKDDPIFDGESDIPARPWISVYIEESAGLDKEKPLRIDGFFSKPFMYWRFNQASDSVYGYGLGTSAIVTVIALNNVAMTNMIAAQLEVDPPLWVHDNLRNRVRSKPGGRTYYANSDEVVQRLFDRNIAPGLEREERLSGDVEQHFDVPFYLMLSRSEKPMTATEIIERTGERALLMGPKRGGKRSDLYLPIHNRVFEMALSNEWVPPPPDILVEQSDGRIDVEFIGPLDQAQKRLFETRKTQEVLAQIGPIGERFPAVFNNFNWDKTVRRIARDGFWPEDEIRPEEEVAAKNQAELEAAQVQAQLEIAIEAAKNVPAAGKAAEAGSPLDQLQAASV